jgi:acyl carrier protein
MLLSDALTRRLRQNGRPVSNIDVDLDLIESGLVDSQALLDVILAVESQCGLMFDFDEMDFERGVTLRQIAAALAAPA